MYMLFRQLIVSLFVNNWQCGSITDFSLIKTSLIVVNVIGFLVIKVLLIQSQQSVVVRDLVVLHGVYFQYTMTYACSFPYLTFSVYLIAYFEIVACRHLLDSQSTTFQRSIIAKFQDPDNFEELCRLNMEQHFQEF